MTYTIASSRYAVIDLETTGFSAKTDRVVEMACVLIEDGAVVESWATLVDPQRDIPRYATDVHGIRNEDVRGAPRFAVAQRRLEKRCEGATIVAHNFAFDISFLPRLQGRPALCTLWLARLVFPNAPNHKNQTLRTYLQLDQDPILKNMGAHRALADAMTTAAILNRCLKRGPQVLDSYRGLRSA